MTEDSGAFKTNPADFGRVPAFCTDARAPLQPRLRLEKTLLFPHAGGISQAV
jgi:hypothetical protein